MEQTTEQRQPQTVPQTCQHCRWYKIAEGEHLLPWSNVDGEQAQKDVEFCCFNPPTSGLYPWSFGETDGDATCSKWEAMPEAKPDGVEG